MKGMVPFCTDRSEWHTPLAAMRTLTSCGPTGSRVISSTTKGAPTSRSTAARPHRGRRRRRHDAAAAPGTVTVSVSRPDRRTAPGSAPVNVPGRHDLGAVHQDVLDALGFGVEAAGPAGQIGAGALGELAHPVGIEDDDVGPA